MQTHQFKSPRNIVICCDGTNNQYGLNNTNVVKTFEMLVSDDTQKIFYDPGVGTTSVASLEFFQDLSNIFFQALGTDLQKNVEEAYLFLMNTYQTGDRIFLFGFSRGAHTVRRLANLLEVCELLHKGSDNMLPYVTKLYLKYKGKRNQIDDNPVLNGFRKTFSRPCPVYFIGVWDTVSALSNLYPRPKMDGSLSQEVNYAYHALAIDERRLQFPPNLWKNHLPNSNQTIEQVWFAGVHSDVGGSYKEVELSNIPLKWMLEKAKNAGLKIKEGELEKLKLNPSEKQNESWSGKWWIIPSYIYLTICLILIGIVDHFHPTEIYKNLGLHIVHNFWTWPFIICFLALLVFLTQKKRKIPSGSKVHRSVKERLDNSSCNYKPKYLVRILDSIEWVD